MDYDLHYVECVYLDMDRKAEKINARVDELMQHSYDPNNAQNISEAISQATEEEHQSIAEYAFKRDYEKLGRLIKCISYEYHEKMAQEIAEHEFNRGRL